MFGKIGEMILSRSNSYNFYKNHYYQLTESQNRNQLEIKHLKTDLANKNEEILFLRNRCDELTKTFEALNNKYNQIIEINNKNTEVMDDLINRQENHESYYKDLLDDLSTNLNNNYNKKADTLIDIFDSHKELLTTSKNNLEFLNKNIMDNYNEYTTQNKYIIDNVIEKQKEITKDMQKQFKNQNNQLRNELFDSQNKLIQTVSEDLNLHEKEITHHNSSIINEIKIQLDDLQSTNQNLNLQLNNQNNQLVEEILSQREDLTNLSTDVDKHFKSIEKEFENSDVKIRQYFDNQSDKLRTDSTNKHGKTFRDLKQYVKDNNNELSKQIKESERKVEGYFTNQTKQLRDDSSKKNDRLYKNIKKDLDNQEKLTTKHLNIVGDSLNTKFTNTINNKFNNTLEKKLNKVIDKKFNENIHQDLDKKLDEIQKNIQNDKGNLYPISMMINEVRYGIIFKDTILNSPWYANQTVSLNNSASNYSFMYILYRILDETKPDDILELGLGQTSKMTTQYANYFNKNLIIIDNNQEWIDVFTKDMTLSDSIQIVQHDIEEFEGERTVNYKYKDLDKTVKDRKFNLVIIDGPQGFLPTVPPSLQEYPRSNIVSMIDNLSEDFVIILDDYDRLGEQNTFEHIIQALEKNKIKYEVKVFKGLKHQVVICSESNKFVTWF